MKYHGSKMTIAKDLAEFIRNDTDYEMFFSPFCGACAVERLLVNHFEISFFNDISTDLIMFLQELYDNVFEFPESTTEEEYVFQKTAEPSALRCFYGHFLSFAGKWFGGYAQKYQRGDRIRDFNKEATDSAKRLQSDLIGNDIIFDSKSYDEFTPFGMCIYADPPYHSTTNYGTNFDHDLFWETMRKWSQHNDVYVSEYDCPFDDFECVFELPKRVTMSHDKSVVKFERLFKLKKI
jgi:site-specific DNA-adenine methylase